MRAIWKGSISFGLVNIPVSLYSASQYREGLDLDMLHKKDHGRIKYIKVCQLEGKEIPYDEIVRGYEISDGDYIELTTKDFEKAEVGKTKTIDIRQFVDEMEIDSRYYEKPYYLEPSKGAEKPYNLLREALKRSKTVALATFVMRATPSMAAIKPIGRILILNKMRFPADIKSGSDLNIEESKASEQEVKMALALVDQLNKPFIPEDWHDSYTENLLDIIKEKASGRPVKPRGKPPNETKVQDLMAALKASLKKEKSTKQ